MRINIVIHSTENQKQELLEKGFNNNVNVDWVKADKQLHDVNADVYFDLAFNDVDLTKNKLIKDKPVFVHAVNSLCREINCSNYIRLNAWSGFLNRSVMELCCCSASAKQDAETIFKTLGWNFVWIADDYGFIAARIVAMIINEAYYALEENVSTKEQIDMAMKLGTNYPYGPFEWCKKIGLDNIVYLLKRLSAHDERYSISELLIKESQQL